MFDVVQVNPTLLKGQCSVAGKILIVKCKDELRDKLISGYKTMECFLFINQFRHVFTNECKYRRKYHNSCGYSVESDVLEILKKKIIFNFLESLVLSFKMANYFIF